LINKNKSQQRLFIYFKLGGGGGTTIQIPDQKILFLFLKHLKKKKNLPHSPPSFHHLFDYRLPLIVMACCLHKNDNHSNTVRNRIINYYLARRKINKYQ